MSKWRRLTLEKVPVCKHLIEEVENPMALWIELLSRLELAYKAEPREEKVIQSIFEYASWCLQSSHKSKSYDMRTEVIVAFYEHLPTHETIRRDLRYRMSREDFFTVGPAWNYLLCAKESENFRQSFFAAKDRKRNAR